MADNKDGGILLDFSCLLLLIEAFSGREVNLAGADCGSSLACVENLVSHALRAPCFG